MRINLKSKKEKRAGKVRVIDNFCVAYLKLITNNDNGLYRNDELYRMCESPAKPKNSCEKCIYNREMERWESQ
jgi:hypothetical protein